MISPESQEAQTDAQPPAAQPPAEKRKIVDESDAESSEYGDHSSDGDVEGVDFYANPDPMALGDFHLPENETAEEEAAREQKQNEIVKKYRKNVKFARPDYWKRFPNYELPDPEYSESQTQTEFAL